MYEEDGGTGGAVTVPVNIFLLLPEDDIDANP
jgi:hypothetical protein